MSQFDRFFQGSEQTSHPMEFQWKPLLEHHRNLACKIYWPIEEMVRGEPTEALVTADGELVSGPVDWDKQLDAFLIKNGIRAISEENESLRFGLVLREDLGVIETFYGDGFYNKILIKYLCGSPFTVDERVARVLQSLAPRAVGTVDTTNGEKTIESVIANVGTQLGDSLKYEQPEAETILSGAVGNYIDVRFSYSARVKLGWVA